ncbi:hypothetical protein ASPWEDRAFT_418070 [Aspergillus wentii DTO 134E9]|uniref:Uncharacterized protein n=1 Tax=Aspergillus wentii DTO 134E9 TaxID=1073089 RepID=A0A1L9RPB9_ASPWE|nr:uncharacterized protein ASPWEDRAFT_418070 [Aspergillus wentii DTO 134E9]OJJ36687.1 hypothetical protein ASPWEDRAFT_418070 [Aspergillus wentii DTO 134E9]
MNAAGVIYLLSTMFYISLAIWFPTGLGCLPRIRLPRRWSSIAVYGESRIFTTATFEQILSFSAWKYRLSGRFKENRSDFGSFRRTSSIPLIGV